MATKVKSNSKYKITHKPYHAYWLQQYRDKEHSKTVNGKMLMTTINLLK